MAGQAAADIQTMGFNLGEGVLAAITDFSAALIQSINWVNVAGFVAGVILVIVGVIGLAGREAIGGVIKGAVGINPGEVTGEGG
jgi:hypothetical protein